MLQNLHVPPNGNDAFFWSDYAEIRALTHPDKCISRADIAHAIHQNKNIDNEDSDTTSEDEIDGGYSITAKTEKIWRLLIDFCGIRKAEFSDSYPYTISDDKDTLFLDFNKSPLQKFYLGLLISSCMRLIPSKQKGKIARAFEESCFYVFTCLMPHGSTIRATWANGGAEAPYTGHLFDKMMSIAKDIRGTPSMMKEDFKENNTGDGGIDLIAWHPMADSRDGIPVSFAQCGCSRDDWTFKQTEASPALHRKKFNVRHDWATYYFMPLDLRRTDGDWAYKSKIGEVIIVDRLRMIRLAKQYDIFDTLPKFEFVDEVYAMAEL